MSLLGTHPYISEAVLPLGAFYFSGSPHILGLYHFSGVPFLHLCNSTPFLHSFFWYHYPKSLDLFPFSDVPPIYRPVF